LIAGLGAALVDQGLPLLGGHIWHPFSLLPLPLIKKYGIFLREVAPFVWPSLGSAAGASGDLKTG
jgi:hypothetical protein